MKRVLFLSFLVLSCMQTVFTMHEAKVKIKTNDDVEIEISREAARSFQTLRAVIDDLPEVDEIPVGISSENLKKIYDLFIHPGSGLPRNFKDLEEAVMRMKWQDLFFLLQDIAYLEPRFFHQDAEKDFLSLLQKKIVNDRDAALKDLNTIVSARNEQEPFPDFPLGLRPELVQLLLESSLSKQVFDFREHFEIEDNIDFITWDHQDGLALIGGDHVYLFSPDLTQVHRTPLADLNMFEDWFAWSSQGSLAMGGVGKVLILSPNPAVEAEEIEVVHPDEEVNSAVINLVGWLPDNSLIFSDRYGLYKKVLDHEEYQTLVDFHDEDFPVALAISHDGIIALLYQDKNVELRDGEGKILKKIQINFSQDLSADPEKRFGWSQSGVLVIANENEVAVVDLNGQVALQELPQYLTIFSLTFSSQEYTAFKAFKRVFIREPGGKLFELDLNNLKRVYKLAWSRQGRLAIQAMDEKDNHIVLVREPDGLLKKLDTQGISDIRDFHWTLDEKLVLVDENIVFHTFDIIVPQEYRNLTLAQALILIKLSRNDDLSEQDRQVYNSLPDLIRKRYPR